MNIEETARDAAIASAGGKTALTSGGALVGWGLLSSEWVFGIIGACIGLAGLAIQYHFQKRRRDDEREQAVDQNRRAEEIHKLKIQLFNKQIHGVACAEEAVTVVSPLSAQNRLKSPLLSDFGGLDD